MDLRLAFSGIAAFLLILDALAVTGAWTRLFFIDLTPLAGPLNAVVLMLLACLLFAAGLVITGRRRLWK